jgi:hypothetical protein
MTVIQIDGTFTYIDNIKTLKLGQKIKLVPNPNNRLNSDAVGAYTLDGRKIGYVPYKSYQIDISAIYIVSKISLSQNNPILLISRDLELSNFIEIEYNKENKYNEIKIQKTNFDIELTSFSKFLSRNKINVKKLGITYLDDYFINLLIETPESINIYYTVTKKFYEEHIFKYDEFYKAGLLNFGIYNLFQIHRPEIYIQKNYSYFEKLIKKKKITFSKLLKNNLINEDIINDNFGFEIIESNNFKLNGSNIKCQIFNHLSKYKYLYKISDFNINQNNLNNFFEIFNNPKVGGIYYNHKMMIYSFVDLYDDINIVDICDDFEISKDSYVLLLIKLIIANKQYANIYNPLLGKIYRLEIDDSIKEKVMSWLY